MIHEAYASRDTAAGYVAWRERSLARRLSRRFENRRVRRAAGDAGRVLDMPCGAGRFDAFVSCDRSAGMTALVRDAGARAVRADAFALPFRAGSFDTAFCVRFLHHFDADARGRILRELRRVAGAAVVTYFGATGLKARRRARRRGDGTRRAVDRAAFARECAAAGWRVAADRAVIPLWSEQRIARLEEG